MRRLPLWQRLAALFLGILILFWLPIEDRSTIGVLIFSILMCVFGALAVTSVRPGSRQGQAGQSAFPRLRTSQTILLATWLMAGLAVTGVALLLITIKTGVHGHGAPDYTSEQMARILSLTPLWAVLGLVIGLISIFRPK